MKKLAVIRGSDTRQCPFGLSIVSACKSANHSVLQMEPLYLSDSSKGSVARTNKLILINESDKKHCIFADTIFSSKNKVNCTFDADLEDRATIQPSPLYPRTFTGYGKDPGIYDPRGYYYAPGSGIDVPFGMFSIFAESLNEAALLKVADKYTNKNGIMKEKIAKLRNSYHRLLTEAFSDRKPKLLDENELRQIIIAIENWVE